MAEVVETVRALFGVATRVLPFGSFVQGVHLEGSDLDLCIDVPNVPIDEIQANGKPDNTKQVAALRRLMGQLPSSFRVMETRFWKHMKVPIIVLAYDSSSGLEVETDISVGAVCDGVEKGFTDRLIRRLLAHNPCALHLARIVKLWAKLECLNKAYDGFLNALGWTLLVLYFFMKRGDITSELMNEEEENENGPNGDGSLPPPLHGDVDGENAAEVSDDAPSSEDIADFFEMVADFANWPDDPANGAWGISLVDGEMVEVPTPRQQYKDQTRFFLEDPGIRMATGRSENVARSLKKVPWQTSLDKCQDVVNTLRAGDPAAAEVWIKNLLDKSLAATASKPTPAVAEWPRKRPCRGWHADAQPWQAPPKRARVTWDQARWQQPQCITSWPQPTPAMAEWSRKRPSPGQVQPLQTPSKRVRVSWDQAQWQQQQYMAAWPQPMGLGHVSAKNSAWAWK